MFCTTCGEEGEGGGGKVHSSRSMFSSHSGQSLRVVGDWGSPVMLPMLVYKHNSSLKRYVLSKTFIGMTEWLCVPTVLDPVVMAFYFINCKIFYRLCINGYNTLVMKKEMNVYYSEPLLSAKILAITICMGAEWFHGSRPRAQVYQYFAL